MNIRYDLERMGKEIAILASINHEHVVRYLDAWVERMDIDENKNSF